MKNIDKDSTYYLETSVTDSSGDFVSGLTITYEIRKSSDNSLFASGTLTEVGDAYRDSTTFTVVGQYSIFYVTPSTYENGMEQVQVGEIGATEANATTNKDDVIEEVIKNNKKIGGLY